MPVLAAVFLGIGFASPALPDDDQDKATRLKEAGDILPLEEIIEKARTEHPGRVLEVELDEEGSALHYDLELLDENGVVRELTYDARTGRLIKSDRDD